MKIHLRQIPVEGLHLEGEEEFAILEISDENIKPLGPIRYSLDVGISGSGLFATGTLAVDLQMECVSCLKKFTYPLRVEHFAVQMELPGAEMVDLTPYIREDILLNLPPHPRCDWNGETICEGAKEISLEPAEELPNAWDELDKLKIRNRK
jgi:uncharacterized metal-binding protein YceD (DUF177 family)